MKDVLTEIDDNQYQDTESDSNDIITPEDDEKNDWCGSWSIINIYCMMFNC